MNQCSNLPVKMYSYRIEFQGRGSAHIHGVIWLDIPKLVDLELKSGNDRLKYLQSALETVRQDKLPTDEEASAIEAYIDMVATCSLRIPETKKIAEQVNCHYHKKNLYQKGRRELQVSLPKVSFTEDNYCSSSKTQISR